MFRWIGSPIVKWHHIVLYIIHTCICEHFQSHLLHEKVEMLYNCCYNKI